MFDLDHPKPEQSVSTCQLQPLTLSAAPQKGRSIHKGAECPRHRIQCIRDQRLSSVRVYGFRDTQAQDHGRCEKAVSCQLHSERWSMVLLAAVPYIICVLSG